MPVPLTDVRLHTKGIISNKDRTCSYCKEHVPIGSKCLRVKKMNGRIYMGTKHMCQTCAIMAEDVYRAKLTLEQIPFGDDGAYVAYVANDENYNELKSELLERWGRI